MNSYKDTSTHSILSDRPAKSLSSRSDLVWTLMACAATLPWIIYIIAAYINLDFWYDEIYTLDHFVFVPISKTLTDYHVPNNHIFANLLNHLYLHNFDIDYNELLRNPWKIRILMLFYTFLTFAYVYRTMKDFFSPEAGFLTITILGSTLPFINFTVQVRGYTLSMTLLSILLYYNLHFLKTGNRMSGFLVIIITSLFFYTIPSNIYVIAPIFIYWLLKYSLRLGHKFTQTERKLTIDREITLAIMTISGVIIATIWYVPTFPKLFDFVRTSGLPNLRTIKNLMPAILEQLISKRWLLLLPVLYGLMRISRKKQNNFYLFPTLIVLPFLMSALRGDKPFDRTFIVICIPFSMVAGIALAETVNGMNNRLKFIFLTLIVIITSSSFYFSITSRDQLLLSKLESGMIINDITNNYYQNYYRPSALMREFIEKYQEESIFLKPASDWKWDAVAMPKYLAYWSEIYGKTLKEVYEYSDVEIREDWIQSKKPIYLVTNDANVLHLLKSRYPVLDCRRITSPGQFGMVIECNHSDQLKIDQNQRTIP